VLGAAALPLSEVALVARCGAPERLPDPETTELLGVVLPLVTLAALEVSAPAKLSRALAMFDGGLNRRI
jgi:hypothetical protein